ncbi:MAG: hypothetical protein KF901_26470 [Myxococcales bacterium]|nr:hypothetical protein [Myxococcales bacterium]
MYRASFLVFALSVLAGGAHAQEPFGREAVSRTPNHDRAETGARVAAYLPVQGGGSILADFDPGGAPRVALNASLGLGLRFEYPIMKYLSVGVLWELLSMRVDGRRNAIGMDTDLWIKGRYVFGITTRLDVEAYVGVPIGLSWMRTSEGALSIANPGVGLNTGFHTGATAIIDGRFGVFLDLGMRHRRIYTDTAVGTDLTLSMSQFAWNVGGVLVF